MRDEHYLDRCCELAMIAGKSVWPNPNVGCVIVHKDRVLGEGYHEKYGSHHAEVNAINNVSDQDKYLLPHATIYVSLEPCCHHGKTPPCTEKIIENKIRRVVIGAIDKTAKVNSKGIQKLRAQGVKVDVLDHIRSKVIANQFHVNQLERRPYVLLKWAMSKNNVMGSSKKQLWFSSESSKIVTHRLRANTDAILVGKNTVAIDNPSLTTRDYPGDSPIRIILDSNNTLDTKKTVFTDGNRTIIINKTPRRDLGSHIQQIHIHSEEEFLLDLLHKLYKINIRHLVVEGGRNTLDSFIKMDLWDEALFLKSKFSTNGDILAPNIHGVLIDQYKIDSDQVTRIANRKRLLKS